MKSTQRCLTSWAGRALIERSRPLTQPRSRTTSRSGCASGWGLEPREIRARVGVSEKHLEKILEQAYKSVAAELVRGLADGAYVDDPREPVISVALFVVSGIDMTVDGRPGS
jgi:hypothetical protein